MPRSDAEYGTWVNMKTRCSNPKSDRYPFYGGRGIKVCDRWLEYDNFIADMGCKPTPQHTLDRRDNNGNYEPGNCFWATKQEQARNRRSSCLWTFDGQTKTQAEWVEITGLPQSVLNNRVNQMGWSIERALSTPVRGKP